MLIDEYIKAQGQTPQEILNQAHQAARKAARERAAARNQEQYITAELKKSITAACNRLIK